MAYALKNRDCRAKIKYFGGILREWTLLKRDGTFVIISVTVIKTGVEFFSAQGIFNAYVSLRYRILVRYMDQSKSQRS